jgi:glyoxylate reductase
MKVFVTRILPGPALKQLEMAGLEVEQWTEKRKLTQEELIAHCSNADALLSAGQQIDEEFLTASKHLKVIALHSVGYDNVDIDAATKLNIPIGNTPGVLSDATADTAFLLMLATSRNAFYMHQQIINGDWGFFEPTANLGKELKGRTLGLFGLGKIGLEMAKRCAGAYEMKIIYHNRSRNELAEKEVNATYVSFEELLQQSDVLSVHTALTPETEGRFTIDAFRQMKPDAIFVNTARGSIHNEADLTLALQQKLIWGAGLDVTNPEPMSPGNPLLKMPNVCILPHIGSATETARYAMAEIAARNIIAGVNGKRLPHIVNPEVYES